MNELMKEGRNKWINKIITVGMNGWTDGLTN